MSTISFILLAIFFTFVSPNKDHEYYSIVNSGSTNTAGYVIEVQRNGLVKWTVAPRFHQLTSTTPSSSSTTAQNHIQLSKDRTNDLFSIS
jgi:hypothetical protein